MHFSILKADYSNPQHAAAIVYLLNHYAEDLMGGGRPLPVEVSENLVAELAQRPFALSLLAYTADTPVGLVNAFEGFSTFACKPLINIHDIAVHRDYRGQGVGRQLLAGVEQIANERGCCKLTLEVLSDNSNAKVVYQRFGFAPYSLRADTGNAEFWQKLLD